MPTGPNAKSDAGAIQQLPEALLAGVWDDHPQRGEQAADGDETVFDTELDVLLVHT